ncbi:hypothetical protein [Streptomyces sp. NPDC053069]
MDTHQVKLDTRVTATVDFRTGPGTGYTSLGLLPKGQGVIRCGLSRSPG